MLNAIIRFSLENRLLIVATSAFLVVYGSYIIVNLPIDVLPDIPYVLIGTVEEIVVKIRACRDRWGITYYSVRELDDFEPVIAALR